MPIGRVVSIQLFDDGTTGHHPGHDQPNIQIDSRRETPDVAVLCESPAFYDDRRDTVTNPTLLIEVLAPSSEGYDRGAKFACYRTLPTLSQHVLVAQDRVAVDVLTRESDNRWVISSFDAKDQQVPLESIGCTLPMVEIYARIQFPPRDRRVD